MQCLISTGYWISFIQYFTVCETFSRHNLGDLRTAPWGLQEEHFHLHKHTQISMLRRHRMDLQTPLAGLCPVALVVPIFLTPAAPGLPELLAETQAWVLKELPNASGSQNYWSLSQFLVTDFRALSRCLFPRQLLAQMWVCKDKAISNFPGCLGPKDKSAHSSYSNLLTLYVQLDPWVPSLAARQFMTCRKSWNPTHSPNQQHQTLSWHLGICSFKTSPKSLICSLYLVKIQRVRETWWI